MRSKKLKVTSVSLGLTINMGNYESTRVDMTVLMRLRQELNLTKAQLTGKPYLPVCCHCPGRCVK